MYKDPKRWREKAQCLGPKEQHSMNCASRNPRLGAKEVIWLEICTGIG